METSSMTHTAGITALVLAIIGALNWLLVGLFRFNLVSAIFGDMSVLSRIVYVVVGLAGLYLIAAARTFFPSASGSGVANETTVTSRRQPAA
jgi:uncharacterized membrane protein YuzA (DUF378 family)